MKTLFAAALAGCLLSLCSCQARQAQPYGGCKVQESDKLILYTSHKEEVYGPIVREFEARTGIWVKVTTGGTTKLLESIRTSSGNAICDVMFGGGVESFDAYQECFSPYRCSQEGMLDPTYSSPQNLWTVFSDLPIVFIYNNKLVSQDQAPKSWKELLSGQWKGKIAFASPDNSGTSYTALATMVQLLGMDEKDLVKAFTTALDGKVSDGSQGVVDQVCAGTRLVGVTLEETARKRMAQGADISMAYPAEGTSQVPDGSALVKGSPHEGNAKRFIDFTVSRDVQKMVATQFCRRSVRKDIHQKGDNPGLKIMDFDLDWAARHQESILGLWAHFMGKTQKTSP